MAAARPDLKIGVVGATGMVGKAFMSILEERAFPLAELRPFASDNSLGKKIPLRGREWAVQTLKPGCFDGLDLVFFSSGDEISAEWAPRAVKAGAFAVDNSAAFRMDASIALVVPEVNGHLLKPGMKPAIIANPNCSTIQLVVALKPLERFGLEEVRVSSYQAVSGGGQAAHDELIDQVKDHENPSPSVKVFPHPILFNVIPQIGSFNDDGFCSEEVKIMKETRKILGAPELKVSAFTVRVPALNSHSEAVWVTLGQDVGREQVLQALHEGAGLVVQDDPKSSVYPLPRQVSGLDPVHVGRVHRDPENPRLWLMWVVSDNIRKGAALNGLQIAERIFDIRTGP
ncbi:MAG: aspartate-semialdehyde dehydrogenase [Bdellovibrionaceae bacterium]|nr:aspartate-semialdehyde dehydrogenase [Pseudobdellovibrionaceae bacterium]MBX3032743.1 aspartate-semialdehyde dehydrogenase [Pseudobdellovibrionaceae bacterium]